MQEGADIPQCTPAWMYISPTGSLLAGWTVGPDQILGCTSVVMDQPQISSFGVKAQEG